MLPEVLYSTPKRREGLTLDISQNLRLYIVLISAANRTNLFGVSLRSTLLSCLDRRITTIPFDFLVAERVVVCMV